MDLKMINDSVELKAKEEAEKVDDDQTEETYEIEDFYTDSDTISERDEDNLSEREKEEKSNITKSTKGEPKQLNSEDSSTVI